MNKVKLIMLHFAGGNAFSFRFMLPYLKAYDVIALELPGRGKTYRTPLVTDFDKAVQELYSQVIDICKGIPSGPFIIYGHSMGAALALHLAALLEQSGHPPLSLVVTGYCGPGVGENKNLHLMEDRDFLDELVKMGGISKELLQQEELLQIFLPILKADFAIVENCPESFSATLNTPIYAAMGSEEEDVDAIQNWQQFTRAQFTHTILPGDHFFIQHHAQEIAALIQTSHSAHQRVSS
jgi:external thioesterase TEII